MQLLRRRKPSYPTIVFNFGLVNKDRILQLNLTAHDNIMKVDLPMLLANILQLFESRRHALNHIHHLLPFELAHLYPTILQMIAQSRSRLLEDHLKSVRITAHSVLFLEVYLLDALNIGESLLEPPFSLFHYLVLPLLI